MHRFAIQRSFVPRKGDVVRKWYLVDAEQETLGRMATQVAQILMGKNKPTYTPHIDCGDGVVVINAEKVGTTGRKTETKSYFKHTLYLGGLREHSLAWMVANKPKDVIELAVRRMLPKNALGRKMLGKLKIYTGAQHEHAAQEPTPISFTNP
ncbi:MAG: 50S ribosomal protein L13 [Planctomycetota bacterium]